jgi:hypothetical protein
VIQSIIQQRAIKHLFSALFPACVTIKSVFHSIAQQNHHPDLFMPLCDDAFLALPF